jgi:hypothetical protein
VPRNAAGDRSGGHPLSDTLVPAPDRRTTNTGGTPVNDIREIICKGTIITLVSAQQVQS